MTDLNAPIVFLLRQFQKATKCLWHAWIYNLALEGGSCQQLGHRSKSITIEIKTTMPRYIAPYQVKQLIIAASKTWKNNGLEHVFDGTFDEWRADVCESKTGQKSFRRVTTDRFDSLARVFGIEPAKPPRWGGRVKVVTNYSKGQYYLRKVIEEHRLTEGYVSKVCDSLFNSENWRALSDAEAKKLGHILQRKTKPGGGDCPAGV